MSFWSIISVGIVAVVVWKGAKKFIKLYKLKKEFRQSQKDLLSWYPFFALDEAKYGILDNTETIEFMEENYKAASKLEFELGIALHTKEDDQKVLQGFNDIKYWVNTHEQNRKNYWEAKNS